MQKKIWPFWGTPRTTQEMPEAIGRVVTSREFDSNNNVVGGSLGSKALGEVVKTLREEKGMDRAKLAKISGLDQVFLALLENGQILEKEITWLVKDCLRKSLKLSFRALDELVNGRIS